MLGAMANASPPKQQATKSIKSLILSEHFRFAPESFAKSCFDIANKCLYVASGFLEDELLGLLKLQQQQQQQQAGDGAEQQQLSQEEFDQQHDEIQRGCYRLETLLEQEIDKRFDLFEIFMLRNTFNFQDHLIPYFSLPHQAHLDPTLAGTDQQAIDEYEQELRLFQLETAKQRQLKAVELFLREKELKLDSVKEEIGWLGFGGERNPLDQRSSTLAPALTALSAALETFLATPSPSLLPASSSSKRQRSPFQIESGSDDDDAREAVGAWNASRTSFVNWVASKQSVSTGIEATTSTAAPGKSQSNRRIASEAEERVGSKQDAKVCEDNAPCETRIDD
ncbi:MIND complex subunit MTW1 [Sporobolomyces koalae]|uniref:MIND complex subunit MTW1 n=1 Tax=Sporobolomyces koalae TaxID=500713 RepID=UPI00317228E2